MSEQNNDREILRELGRRKVEVGNLSIQKERAGLWCRLNKLQPVRPLVLIYQIPWHELDWTGDLEMRCQDPFLRSIEMELRTELHQWTHFPGDMVVEPVIYSALVGGPSSSYGDYGLVEQLVRGEGGHDVGFAPIIHTEADADKIRTPYVWFDRDATEKNYQTLCQVFDGVIPVKKRGIVHQWQSPWDQIIHWYGIEQLYADMYDRPELVHRILRNFSKALGEVLTQQEAMGMLDIGNGNYSIGSGGLGFTDELPQPDFNPAHVRPIDQWGCSTGQIFSEVSPDMHEEFCLQYERPMLARFGLTYYGCCEQLHKKVGMLRSVKNLRKISMSPWANVAEGAEQIGKDYVFSFKPNPAHLGMHTWDPDLVRNYLTDAIHKTRNNFVEVILKDVSTICREPRRLSEWAKIAKEIVEAT